MDDKHIIRVPKLVIQKICCNNYWTKSSSLVN